MSKLQNAIVQKVSLVNQWVSIAMYCHAGIGTKRTGFCLAMDKDQSTWICSGRKQSGRLVQQDDKTTPNF
jgi:hypothetical protein